MTGKPLTNNFKITFILQPILLQFYTCQFDGNSALNNMLYVLISVVSHKYIGSYKLSNLLDILYVISEFYLAQHYKCRITILQQESIWRCWKNWLLYLKQVE